MKSSSHRIITVLSLGLVLLTCGAALAEDLPAPAVEPWTTPLWRDVEASMDGAKGSPFVSMREFIEDKIAHPPVFPKGDDLNRSDEVFLVSPRNTKVRASSWNRNFVWNFAVDGRDYILHVYSGDNEVVKRTMGMARRAYVSEHEAPFIPGVEYSWDVSLCVERCNLKLSARPSLRPRFTLMSAAEEAGVSTDLDAVGAWCEGRGMAKSEEEAALSALVLERAGLYMEEQQLLEKELKRRPGSILLHLVLSGALMGMNSPSGAKKEYEAARALVEKAREKAAGTAP
jgi:hypothetical protein